MKQLFPFPLIYRHHCNSIPLFEPTRSLTSACTLVYTPLSVQQMAHITRASVPCGTAISSASKIPFYSARVCSFSSSSSLPLVPLAAELLQTAMKRRALSSACTKGAEHVVHGFTNASYFLSMHIHVGPPSPDPQHFSASKFKIPKRQLLHCGKRDVSQHALSR